MVIHSILYHIFKRFAIHYNGWIPKMKKITAFLRLLFLVATVSVLFVSCTAKPSADPLMRLKLPGTWAVEGEIEGVRFSGNVRISDSTDSCELVYSAPSSLVRATVRLEGGTPVLALDGVLVEGEAFESLILPVEAFLLDGEVVGVGLVEVDGERLTLIVCRGEERCAEWLFLESGEPWSVCISEGGRTRLSMEVIRIGENAEENTNKENTENKEKR
jgi:hypothetical protein